MEDALSIMPAPSAVCRRCAGHQPAAARMRPTPIPGWEGLIRPLPTLVPLVIATALTAAPIAPSVAVAAPHADKDGHGAFQRAVLRSVNSVRAHHRLPPLRSQSRPTRAASAHSADQLRSGRPSHRSADGTTAQQRLRRYSPARKTGETIAWLTAEEPDMVATIVGMWLASPSHRRVLMDRRFRRLGVGVRSGVVRNGVTTAVTADGDTTVVMADVVTTVVTADFASAG